MSTGNVHTDILMDIVLSILSSYQLQLLTFNPAYCTARRVAVNAAVKGYIETAYHQNKVVAAIYATDDGRITICLSAKHSKLSSFW